MQSPSVLLKFTRASQPLRAHKTHTRGNLSIFLFSGAHTTSTTVNSTYDRGVQHEEDQILTTEWGSILVAISEPTHGEKSCYELWNTSRERKSPGHPH